VIAYIETNFILELAFLQKEHPACTSLLDMARNKEVGLVVPAYSLAEPYEKLIRRRIKRRELSYQLRDELSEFGRSADHAEDAQQYAGLVGLLITSSEEENQRLGDMLARLLEVAEVIPTDGTVMQDALAVQQTLGLGPQDSIIYASVRRHVQSHSGPRCFLNKNIRDFATPLIQDELQALNCLLIPTFSDGLAYLLKHQ